MGILNVTPDSFSDGGRFRTVQAAVDAALQLIDHGAGIVDVGGESTRPSAVPVGAEEERRRVVPVIAALRARTNAVLSVDTYRASVAHAALEAGADIVNDISGGSFEPDLLQTVATVGAGLVLMHTTDRPAAMMQHIVEGPVVEVVHARLQTCITKAIAAGIGRSQLVIDPGFGFGKSPAQNLALLAELGGLHALDLPILAGVSRKRMIREVVGTSGDALEHGTTVAHVIALQAGARVLRTHNVRAAVAAVRMVAAVQQNR